MASVMLPSPRIGGGKPVPNVKRRGLGSAQGLPRIKKAGTKPGRVKLKRRSRNVRVHD